MSYINLNKTVLRLSTHPRTYELLLGLSLIALLMTLVAAVLVFQCAHGCQIGQLETFSAPSTPPTGILGQEIQRATLPGN